MQGRSLTSRQRAKFLKALAQTANVTASAQSVNANRRTLYDHRAAHPEFAAAWDEAIEEATDALEAEARRRALEGVDELVTCKDGLVYDADGKPVTQKRYSDSLMALLLRAHRKDKFRDNQSVEHTGPGGKALAPATINVTIGAPDAV